VRGRAVEAEDGRRSGGERPPEDDRPTRDLLCLALERVPPIDRVVFAGGGSPPDRVHAVPFPRLGLVADGRLAQLIGGGEAGATRILQTSDTALFVPAGAWNDPCWAADEPVETLELSFDKQTLGLVSTRWDGHRRIPLAGSAVPRRGPRTGAFVLQALDEAARRPEDVTTPALLARALISHARDLMRLPTPAATHSAALMQAIRDHVDAHCRERLTREAVAAAFGITPDHLSHLFRRESRIGFTGYLTTVRLERAKALLRDYDLSIKEIADRCGYADGNYFCRVFRRATDRTPSEYRIHYHSRGGSPPAAAEPE
jgi:AraC-like DNA-binding protein